MVDLALNELQPGISTLPQVEQVLGLPADSSENVFYGELGPLTVLNFRTSTVSAFLKDGVLRLMVVGAPSGKGFVGTEAEWREKYGAPQDFLPSRQGKNAYVLVYARSGMAVHVVSGRVELVELFPRMVPSEYKRLLYREPPAWKE